MSSWELYWKLLADMKCKSTALNLLTKFDIKDLLFNS